MDDSPCKNVGGAIGKKGGSLSYNNDDITLCIHRHLLQLYG